MAEAVIFFILLIPRICDGWDEQQRKHGKEMEELENKEINFHQLEEEKRHLRN